MEIGFPQGLSPRRSFTSVAECFSTWCLMPPSWGGGYLTILEVLQTAMVKLLLQNTHVILEPLGAVPAKNPRGQEAFQASAPRSGVWTHTHGTRTSTVMGTPGMLFCLQVFTLNDALLPAAQRAMTGSLKIAPISHNFRTTNSKRGG